MQRYSRAEVLRILGLSAAQLRRHLAAGLVQPQRQRGMLSFSFQDLVSLRTAAALAGARLPARRITRSLQRVRAHLPPERPLSALRLSADAGAVVVSDGRQRWQAHDGQYLLDWAPCEAARAASIPLRRAPAAPGPVAAMPEGTVPARKAAMDASSLAWYALEARRHPGAAWIWLEWGLALHEQGQLRQAALVYARGIKACPGEALLHFNLGVLREDLGQPELAMHCYRLALARDATLDDAHFNLGLLYRARGETRLAVRHLAACRRMQRSARPERADAGRDSD